MKSKKTLWRALRIRGKRLHRDEQGDEGVNKTLIIALIGVPLIAVLVTFGTAASGWLADKQDAADSKQDTITNAYKPKGGGDQTEGDDEDDSGT